MIVRNFRIVAIDSDELWKNVEKMIREKFSIKDEKAVERSLANVKECIKRRDHLTVFQVTAGVDASDVKATMLMALLKGGVS